VREAKGNLEAEPVQVGADLFMAKNRTYLTPIAPVQVDNASVCRFLERLRDLVGNGYVSSYGDAVDGAHAIDGIWSTEELRAAIAAALGEK